MAYKTKKKIKQQKHLKLMGRFIFILYTAAAPILAAGYLFSLIFTPRRGRLAKLGPELKERLAVELPALPQKALWFHAASMGEVKAISVLAPLLAKKLDNDFFITTSTATGKKEALKITENVTLMPVDFYPFVKKLIEQTKPVMLINAETEIWPAAFHLADEYGIPVYIASARISQGTFSLYKKLSPLTEYIFRGVRKVLCQSESDAERYRRLKGLEGRVYVTGNLKYDQTSAAEKNTEITELMRIFNPHSAPVFTAGCTHPEEEGIILEGYKKALEHIPELKLVIAPRHLEQISITEKNIRNAELNYTVWPDSPAAETAKSSILLINRTGVLQSLYSCSAVCFTGGTLDNTGGHNLLEPALFSRPVLFGPGYRTAKIAGDALVKNKGGFIIRTADDLAKKLKSLILHPEALAETEKNSYRTLKELQGATNRTLNMIP